MPFTTEQELFDSAVQSDFFVNLRRSFTMSTYLIEPRGLFGIPDLVVAGIQRVERGGQLHSVAFEMKLSNWSRALIQAFRYRSFAMISYVVLDAAFVSRALKNIYRFHQSNIGLLSVDVTGSFTDHFSPAVCPPYSEHIERRFHKLVRQHGMSGFPVS